MDNPTKKCRMCGEEKQLTDFGILVCRQPKKTYHYVKNVCKPCDVVRIKRWRNKNPERRRETSREQHLRYRCCGLTLADYDRMLTEQNGLCAICGKPEIFKQGGQLRRLAVDHNHTTGKVRQLLCHLCNQMIGQCHENPATLRAAAAYLEFHTAGVRQCLT